MTREQYRILCKMRSRVTKAKRDYARLSKLNSDPDNQHEWDNMKVADGRLFGLEYGLAMLEKALKPK